MADKPIKTPSPSEFEPNVVRRSLVRAGKHGSRLLTRSILRRLRGGKPNPASIKSMAKPFLSLTGRLATQPDTLLFAQMRLLKDSTEFWSGLLASQIGNKPLSVVEPDPDDGQAVLQAAAVMGRAAMGSRRGRRTTDVSATRPGMRSWRTASSNRRTCCPIAGLWILLMMCEASTTTPGASCDFLPVR